ncbi:threonine--tRNA ligase [Williamsoniiplasma lucivorax]|uniref:Threonine--tRNA ligase n=1 Tax=Williamsoniiplasma lucivorax TaxID=209274 RepID=A0A2S5REV0_9MOLU|nr:threonine--tRNA ligase [Williamsoniiplasma lucivorax]PPE05742.1 threonyl-tRNA synthetase [Williamsoniiplasma lucivorax]
MKIKLLDGSVKEYNGPKSIKEIAIDLSTSLGKTVIAGKVNGVVVPCGFVVKQDSEVEIITNKSEMLEPIINTTAGFLAMVAINKIDPKALNAEITYKEHDMEFNTTFFADPRWKMDEIESLQNVVNQLKDKKHVGFQLLDEQILNKEFAHNKYFLELGKKYLQANKMVFCYELDGVKVVSDQIVLDDLSFVKAIEIQQLTGSYWNDNAKNEMLQRVHGLAASGKKILDEKKASLEERRNNDHREINKQLKIFGFDPLIGQGFPLWLPNGTVVKDEIRKYINEKRWEYNYLKVTTPIVGTVQLYKTSGHWDHYRNDMFQPFLGAKGSEEEFVLRPMNCPHHIGVYRQEPHTYKELPMRICEDAFQFRYESSGSLTGLERVRAMEITDTHIFVRPDQIAEEFKSIYKMVKEILETFHIQIDYLSFSMRDPHDKEKYFDDDQMWNQAEAQLESVLKELGVDYKKMPGEAAFYGPKFDIQIRTVQNHEITVATIQLDFLQPQKFDVTYLDADQQLKRPIMIHCAQIGTYERFIATLLEQHKGALPLWLSPNQVEIISIGDEACEAYAEDIKNMLRKEFVRARIDARDERLAWKIREAQINKIPYQLVLGPNELANNTVNYRQYGSEELIEMSKADFLKKILQEIKDKK